ncbi:hypothetical protein ASE04_07530 [Rhizobium sp. Root708]|uniref:hypothetical protein n=1 Tax=Rhizobium sp. Root708 TaxID=1736592 RepID=UPI0006F517F1|nr:hypothetical protein [Rhizobium sp. Root708]KRB53062.1 hypothetical protein ASE04_07530 [Rhizobium sp. Root708]
MGANMILLRRISLLVALFAAPAVCLAGQFYKASSLHAALLETPIGSIQKMGTLTAPDYEAVCILGPYQDRLNINGDLAGRVNAHLANAQYSSDEGHFAFVFITRQGIEIERIKRSEKLDFFGNRKMPVAVSDAVPRNFSQEECGSGPSAAIIKLRFDDRTYFIFGRAS